ncbi:GNAT family N-acetyltransferase [Actinoplanes sp. TRM 88003]|uniref:GNAT family N-acetyltransferase n=1 Tax=Paractinoplanes aksuensis TaxID=2939490 RepID=A0ABT1DQF4_9ACTN|nr:GNAT family N-acetyltransferase [Actinoplanes aksuensis]MCO8273083.1 GNAT family N-acetyltransferase [Actinoplanes aksuensis]
MSVVANLSRRPAPVETGPFVIGLDPGTDSPHINYATPRPGAAITQADVADLVTAFHDAGRKPRLEYVTGCAPGLEALLIEAGFAVEERHDYLVCSTGSFDPAPVPDGFRLGAPVTDTQRMAMISVQNEAFGGAPTATVADAARVARQQAAGGVAIMAVDGNGGCAGGGQAVPPNGGVSEVAGIAVRPQCRRRGLAGAITAAVTARLFAAGADIAWLEASGTESWRVYERVGYRPAGKRLYIALD